jgi:hypothetical protein
METNLRDFQRQFSKMRAAADRGETVTIEAGEDEAYLFFRVTATKPGNPFAEFPQYMGAINQPPVADARTTIRQRLRARSAR